MRGVDYPASFGRSLAPIGDETAPVTTEASASRGFVGDFLFDRDKGKYDLPSFGFRLPAAPNPAEPPQRPT